MSYTLQNEKRAFKIWLEAARPRTLPVSFPPILVGTALASHHVTHLNWVVIICTLFCSLAIQIGTNLVNDAYDFKKGADTDKRLGPKRMTQSGLLSFRRVLFASFLCFSFSVLCGIPLILIGGWPFLIVILLSIACGYLYTGGPFPLSYTGISDVFILIFFGWVSTCTVYYLQTYELSWMCFLSATQIGLLAIVPQAINNLRDHETDAQANKKTLVVRFGMQFGRWEITFLSYIPFLLGIIWMQSGMLWMALLPLVSLPLVIRNVQNIWFTEPSQSYNAFLATSAKCELIFGCLLALGILLE